MSKFKIEYIQDLQIEPHPNANRLEIATIGGRDGYKSVVEKGQFKNGDSGIYIPEGAVLPDNLIEKLGLVGKLAGSKKNRVKAVKLRGVLSQGVVCQTNILSPEEFETLQDVRFHSEARGREVLQKILNIEKYVPEIPVTMSGQVWNAGPERTVKYDIENTKKYSGCFKEGEEVVMTEKCHGTFVMMGYMPLVLEDYEQGRIVVSSKGHAENGLALKKPAPAEPQSFKQKLFETLWKLQMKMHIWLLDVFQFDEIANELNRFYRNRIKKYQNRGINENNLYWKVFNLTEPFKNVCYAFSSEDLGKPILILGEIFGAGIQDLDYDYVSDSPGFRVFDIKIGERYLNDVELEMACHKLELQRVPVIYRGPYNKEKLLEVTSGKETITGKEKHIREGVVVRPVVERIEPKLGRLQLKSVSEEYLLRKNGTEYT
jgi:tRNA-binding EMAP/Myf-like protein